ncbi:MAG TPA: ATP-binding cassette domain-containing protein [Desulfuromonadales bacterium]|nr:ATP-binding cassette domain-containing protein [Desulfuromonadales bacterium]
MTASTTPMIQVENLTVGYGQDIIVDDVSFEVNRGETFIILGGSGSGKSTLLKAMIGLLPPKKGRVLIDGEDIATEDEQKHLGILRKIGVMYQSGALFGSRTLLENVRLPLEEFTRLPGRAQNLVACLKLNIVDLKGYENYLPAEISGGMKKRAAIARAMALDPEILFLDEPSAGLDPVTQAELDQLVLTLSKNLGMTFVIVTHELPSIYTVADRVIMLEKESRKIIAEGRPDHLRDHSDNPRVRQFFQREADPEKV